VGRHGLPARLPGLCDCELDNQNQTFAGTGGVSQNNRDAGFMPAYKNLSTGEAVISCFSNGSPAPVHVLEGLPDDWVAARDAQGQVCEAMASVVAGFIRDGVFYTRADAAELVADEKVDIERRAPGIDRLTDPQRSR
jgi:hypothetical protein